jgi:polyhydroxyalkanoate synthesis regulator phasin
MAIRIPIITDFSDKGIKDAEKKFSELGTTSEKAGYLLTKAIVPATIAIGAYTKVLKPAITAASDFQEATSKVNVVFGSASKAVKDFADTAARSIGQSKTAVLNAAGVFGTFGKAAGLAGEDLSTFTTDFVTLASDLASFNNTTPEDAIQAIGAALRGEAEPIRRYGILLNDATLKQEAMALGIYKGNGALTAQQKILAAQSAIYKQSTDAQGDFLRTADGLANSQRTLAAEFKNFQIQLGQGLLPKMEQLYQSTLEINDAFRNMPPVVGKSVTALGGLSDKILTLINPFKQLGFLINQVGGFLKEEETFGAYNQNLRRSAQQTMRMADEAGIANRKLIDMGDGAGGAGKAVDEMAKKIKDAREVIEKQFSDALDKAKDKLETAKQAYDDFKQTVSESVTGEFSISGAADAAKEAGTTILNQLTQQATGAQQFSKKVEQLLTMGLSEDALRKVLEAGQEAGGAIANELILGGSEAITGPNGINQLVSDLNYVADALGTLAADKFYKAGVTQGEQYLAGVQSAIQAAEKLLKNPNLKLADVKGIGAKFASDVVGIDTGAPSSPTSAPGGVAAARGGNNYTVNVNGGVLTNAQTGKVVIDAVKSFNRASGPADISVRPISGRY